MSDTLTGEKRRTLDTGVYQVDAPCPICGSLEVILVRISTLVQVPQDDVAKIRVKLHSRPLEHLCRQTKIEVPR